MRKTLTVLAFLLVLGAPLAAKERKPKAGEDAPPFEVLLESDRSEYTTEDVVALTATLSNNTDTDVVVDAALLGARGKYELMAPGSDEVLDSGTWEPDGRKELEPHRVPLKAHRDLSRFVSLPPDLAKLLRDEGQMRVFLEFCDPALGSDGAKPRCVASNAVVLRVRKGGGTQVTPITPR